MPKKENRINHKLFKELSSDSNKFKTDAFLLLYKKSKDCKPYKFSVVVSKKIYKKANKRNKLKRQSRETIKNFLVLHNIHNFCLLFFLKPSLKDKDFNIVKTELEKSLLNFFKQNKDL